MKRVLLPLLAAATLTGCTTTTSGRPPVVTTRTVTASPAGPGANAEGAARIAALACQDVRYARSLDAASRSPFLNQALGKAGAAAQIDRKWADLTSALGFVAALPATGVSAEDQAKADQLNATIDASCSEAGG